MIFENGVKYSFYSFWLKLSTFTLLGLLYLDSNDFAIFTPIGRIRPNIIFILLIGGVNSLLFFFNPKSKKYLTRASFLLILYILTNLISICFIGFDMLRINYGLRIIFLLLCWLIVFFHIENYFKSSKNPFFFVKVLYFFGFIQGIIGLVQFFLSGLRPTGTISDGDADYFGILMMYNLIVIVVLNFLNVFVFNKKFDLALKILFFINLYFSYVRSGWFGFILALFYLSYLSYIKVFGKNSKMQKNIFFFFVAIFCIIAVFFFAIPNLQEFALSRIINDSEDQNSIQNNIRLVMMAESWNNALSSPFIGNGPAAFSIQGMKLDIPMAADFAFDPSIITTLFNDTGIVGAVIFLYFVVYILKKSVLTYKYHSENIQLKYAIAFSVGIFGLLISYIPSTALWIPYSWVFFSIPTALIYSVTNKLSK